MFARSSGALSQVIAETNGLTGALRAYYVRGDDLLAVMRPLVPSPASPADWQTRYYHADGIGSIRALTDETGAVTDTYTYTAFGELLEHVGTDPQPYAFAGEPYDPDAGFQYHRARWMDPRTGRFLGMDPWAGLSLVPSSLHRYSYVGGNPLNLADSSGAISSLIWGVEVHFKVGAEFQRIDPGNRMSDPSINTILRRTTGRPDFTVDYVGQLRPDLVDLQRKEVFEIKPVMSMGAGLFQLEGYLLILNWADPDKSKPWTPGTAATYTPTSPIPLFSGDQARIMEPIDGVIPYDVKDLEMTLIGLAVIVGALTGAILGQHFGSSMVTHAMAPGLP